MAASSFLEITQYPMRTATRGHSRARCKFVFGASGAVSTTTSETPDPAFTLTKSETGVYTLKYPPCAAVDLTFMLYSPLLTVWQAVVTAISPTAGTATIEFLGGSTDVAATEPASGDYVSLELDARTEA